MTAWPTYRGCLRFAQRIGVELAPFQRQILRAVFDGDEREVVAVLPRGSRKTRTMALAGLYVLDSIPGASIGLGASSREQAQVAFDVMKEYAASPALEGRMAARTFELRAEGGGVLRVLSGAGHRAHGRTDDFFLIDELWMHRDDRLLEAAQTGLVKQPHARLAVISTAAATLDSPLGRLRVRAMAGDVVRKGATLDARATGLRWLEWSVPDGADTTDFALVKRANPNPDISAAMLREQHARVTPQAWAQLHLGIWGVSEATWLPPGAWTACRGDYNVERGEDVWVGVDIGGNRDATAVIAVTADLRIAAVHIFHGDEAVLSASDVVREIGRDYVLREIAYDPWRFQSEAVRLEQQEGLPMVEFPQSHARMTAASEALHAAIVERRLQHPDDPDLNRHVAAAVAKATGRGWRLSKADQAQHIDGVVALAMAVERSAIPKPKLKVVGFL